MYQVGYFLTRNATMFPQRLAVVHEDREMSYSELNTRANRLANHLLSMGIKKGERVGLLVRNCLEMVVIWHATQKIGATALPINLRLHADEVAHIMNDARCVMLIYSSMYAGLAQDVAAQCESLGQLIYIGADDGPCKGHDINDLLARGDASEPRVELCGEDESVILYTSGTTGRSKGVMHTQQMVKEYSYMMALETQPANQPTSVLVQSPMFHLGGLQHIWRMAVLGGTIIMVNKIIPEEIFRCIQRYRIREFYLLPPVLIKRLYDCRAWESYDLSSVTAVMCAGGKCSREISEMIFRLFPNSKIRLSYGSTEVFGPTVTYVTQEMIQARPELATTVGTVNTGVEMRLVDKNMHDVLDNTPGEALVRSPMMFRGYLNQPELDARCFDAEGWFHTQDVMYRGEDGYYFIVDRIKDMIKTGGENVYAQEVESVLRDLPDIFDCAVIGIPDPGMGEGVAAAIVTHSGNRLDPEEFLNECRLRMPSYRKPRYWAFMEELPTNSVGKIQKSILREHPEWFEKIK